MVGSVYSLTCTLNGTERLTDSNVTYQWFKDGMVVPGQAMETLSFSSLAISDAGSYSCAIILSSYLLSGPISRNSDPFFIALACKLSHDVWFLINMHYVYELIIHCSVNLSLWTYNHSKLGLGIVEHLTYNWFNLHAC